MTCVFEVESFLWSPVCLPVFLSSCEHKYNHNRKALRMIQIIGMMFNIHGVLKNNIKYGF